MRNFTVEDILCYKTSNELAHQIYKLVRKWDFLDQKTIGIQLIKAMDSVAANIAEGFGRYHKKDKIKFYRYSQGSLKESFDWNEKSKIRKLLSEKQYNKIFGDLQKLPQEINYLINITNQKLSL